MARSFLVCSRMVQEGRQVTGRHAQFESDGSVMAAVTACFSMLLLADFLGVALELGCFLAGITLGFKGHTVVEKVSLLVEPLKDFFSCFFFVSLGRF